MPQIFRPSADTWLRATVVLVFLGVAGGGLALGGYATSGYATAVGFPRGQPVPFSHKHHVGDLGIDCRYCHTTVETEANAGFPPTHTCMTCHSQIWTQAPVLAPVRDSLATGEPIAWSRVSALPDYVYFDHSIHISRGVPCVTCHGRIDRQPLTAQVHPFQMRFCLDCHRNPGPRLRPPDQVTRMDWSGWEADPANRGYGALAMRHFGIDPKALVNCGRCHR